MVLQIYFPPIRMTENTEEKKFTPLQKHLATSYQNKPKIPDEIKYPIFGLIPRPKNIDQKLVTTAVTWSAIGFFVGTCNGNFFHFYFFKAWYHDYHKIPFIQFKESFRFHMKVFFLFFQTF
jgi:hypothetical protein